MGNQKNLRWQMQWAGTQLINTRVLVYEDEYDTPQRQLGTIILPPDPVSILNARPEPYNIEEQVYLMAQNGQQLYAQDGTPLIGSNDQQTFVLFADGTTLALTPDGGPGVLQS